MHLPTPRRTTAALAGGLAVAGLLAAAVPSSAVEGFELQRLAGQNRYGTAAAIADDAFPAGSTNVLIARGDDFPDALAGAYLAGQVADGAPILLTLPGEIPAETESALGALGADSVYVLGGTAAVSDAVFQELDADYDVERVAGDNRYETAAQVAIWDGGDGVGELSGDLTAIVASGTVPADALAAGPLAYAADLPILLTPADSLAEETKGALTLLGIERVVIAGGTAAVGPAVQAEIAAMGITVQREAGLDRYETAVELADLAVTNLGFDDSSVDIARGNDFADALAGGPAAGEVPNPILLTLPTSLSAPTEEWLEDNADSLLEGRVFGGTAAVSDATVDAAELAASGGDGPRTGEVVRVDTAGNRYSFVAENATAASEVEYEDTDTFTVDGALATVAGFESNVSSGDTITYTRSSNTHTLTNVAPASINNRTVGNVDLADDQFDFINDVTGDIVRRNVDYGGDSATFTVDGADASPANFEAAISEGDTLTISGTSFALVNKSVTGTASEISRSDLPPSTQLKIGPYGDIPSAGTDSNTDASGQDDRYQADAGNPVTGGADAFIVEGQESDHATFDEQLSLGDQVTYKREAGVETFSLVNKAPSTISGTAADDHSPDGDGDQGIIDDDGDGGSFTLVTETGPETVEYGPDGRFLVNGALSTEAELEEHYSAGDGITYRPADDFSGTTQLLELIDRDLTGPVGETSTADDTYEVLGPDGTTPLATVTYAEGERFVLNGQPSSMEAFEAALDEIAAGTKSGTVTVVPVPASGEDPETVEHRLVTTPV